MELNENEQSTVNLAFEGIYEEREAQFAQIVKDHTDENIEHFNGASTVHELFDPGTSGAHEALDRAFLISSQWEEFVSNHPTVVMNENAYRAARLAVFFMAETYQLLGQDNVDAGDEYKRKKTKKGFLRFLKFRKGA